MGKHKQTGSFELTRNIISNFMLTHEINDRKEF